MDWEAREQIAETKSVSVFDSYIVFEMVGG
jgi:hypothetical protein